MFTSSPERSDAGSKKSVGAASVLKEQLARQQQKLEQPCDRNKSGSRSCYEADGGENIQALRVGG